jgi:hypothetical protein
MICPHLSDNSCDIAASLAGHLVIANPSACQYCTGLTESPQTINEVTVSLACGSVQGGTEAFRSLLAEHGHWLKRENVKQQRLEAILKANGPGSQLWRLLQSIGVEHTATCPCLDWAERMNAWGPKGCRLARAEIITHMQASAANYGWGDLTKAATKALTTGLAWRLNPLDPYGSLLAEAIRLSDV